LSEKRRPRINLIKRIRKFRGKKPDFVRQESWRYKRLETSWRKPKGIDSKMRLKRKGYHTSPNVGYGSPKDIRSLHPSGFSEILVYKPEELSGLNPEVQAVRIAHTVGGRKKAEIMKIAEKMGLTVINPPKKLTLKAEVEKKKESSSSPLKGE